MDAKTRRILIRLCEESLAGPLGYYERREEQERLAELMAEERDAPAGDGVSILAPRGMRDY